MKDKTLLLLLFLLAALSSASHGQSNFARPDIGVGVVVSDLGRSLDFYTNLIGMVRTGGFDIDADFAKRSGLSGGRPFSVAVLKLENRVGANEWKLMSFGKKARRGKQVHIQDDTGMRYITVNVKALRPIVERLKARGVKFLGETPTPLPDGRLFLLVQDPDGVFVELIGPMDAP